MNPQALALTGMAAHAAIHARVCCMIIAWSVSLRPIQSIRVPFILLSTSDATLYTD